METMASPKIGSREEWAAARAELLVREEEHKRLSDELAQERNGSKDGKASVDDQGGAGDVARCRACEEHQGRRELVGVADAIGWDPR